MLSSRVRLVVLGGALVWLATAYLGPSFAHPTGHGPVPTTIKDSHLAGVDTKDENWRKKTALWWKAALPPSVHAVCRENGTERAFSGALNTVKEPGTFVCSSCGFALFQSEHKFDSGTGWPSFYDEIRSGVVRKVQDVRFGMARTEVRCSRCDAHLGHVFDDGPKPTGLRYCINSVCLLHVPAE